MKMDLDRLLIPPPRRQLWTRYGPLLLILFAAAMFTYVLAWRVGYVHIQAIPLR